MNLIEAAVAILSNQPGQPLHVEEICRLVLERNLLSRPVKDPLRSMKGRLTTELKRGDESRVDKVGPELWQLRMSAADARADAPAVSDAGTAPAAAEVTQAEARAPAVPAAVLDDVLAPPQRPRRGELTDAPEDPQLEKMWGDELAPVPLGAAHAEYRDAQTADEDRPMLPEIVAPRRDRFARARSDRRAKRDANRRRRSEGRAGNAERSEPARDGEAGERASEPARPAPSKDEDQGARSVPREERPSAAPKPRTRAPANPLADAAFQALSTIKGGQAVQVRQLAQMMRKRKLLSEDPQQIWGLLKTALLSDERRHRRLGLRPRIVYKGRGLFALADANPDAELGAAESAFARAVIAHSEATHAALGKRMRKLAIRPLERVVHLYLLHEGWEEVAWIKRVDQYTSYALARPSGAAGKLLVGIRAGGDPVPRRGVGELRAGVEAKNVSGGMLIAPSKLSDDARAEVDKVGPQLATLCGRAMVDAFARTGIGVVASYVPIDYVDDEFFRELDSE